MSTSLSEATTNAVQITGASLTGTSNVSLEELCNITGYKASLPSIAVVGNYFLDNFVALNTNLAGNNEGFKRTLQESTNSQYSNSNMFICTYASSYTARSFKSGNTKIYISSQVVSKDLRISLKDLMSRLSYCTAIEVPEISQEEKIEALKQSSNRKGINLDTKTIQYIINNTSRSLSDLLQLINDIDSFSLKKKKKVSVSLVKEFLNTKN